MGWEEVRGLPQWQMTPTGSAFTAGTVMMRRHFLTQWILVNAYTSDMKHFSIAEANVLVFDAILHVAVSCATNFIPDEK